jgi:diguanylate cyclase (GGDEF)-like protein/PAS domain S-box-containing protein
MQRNVATAQVLVNNSASTTLDSMAVAVVRTDMFGRLTYINRMAENLTGWIRDDALGRPFGEVLRIADRIGRTAFHDAIKLVIGGGSATEREADCIHGYVHRRDGSEFWVESTVVPFLGEDSSIIGTVVTFQDVSEVHNKLTDVRNLAEHDSLTSLPNHRLFDDRLNQAILLAGRQGKELAVILVDIEHFKKINNSLGHDVGDELLRSIAGRLKSCVRSSDTVSRLGGDEFAILLSQIEHREDTAIIVSKTLRALAASYAIDDKSLNINVSMGLSSFPIDGTDGRTLINKATAAMCEAKLHGPNSCQLFRKEMQERLSDRQLLETALRCALGRNEFVLHYQPKVSLLTGQITGLEALIRWVHPKKGLVPPMEFVPIAEECGLILPMGRWVLLEACKQARTWSDSGLECPPIAVNVSWTEFGDRDFVSGVRTALISTGVKASNLELELTESVLMWDTESAMRTMNALKLMGVRLAIDDFGTGYSSFNYLKRFPVNALKLDRSFIREITQKEADATIVSAIINVGNALGQRVIAEGVETLAQAEFLRNQGCDEAQGYFFSRPVDSEQAGKLLENNARSRVAQQQSNKLSPLNSATLIEVSTSPKISLAS